MRKTSTIVKTDASETINVILQNLPDPKDNNVSTIKDEILLNDRKIGYLAQKAKGSAAIPSTGPRLPQKLPQTMRALEPSLSITSGISGDLIS